MAKKSKKKRGASVRGAAGRAKTSASENRSRAQRARRRAERRIPPGHGKEPARRHAEPSRSTRKSPRLHAEDLRRRTAGILAGMPSAPASPPSSRDMEADIARVATRD